MNRYVIEKLFDYCRGMINVHFEELRPQFAMHITLDQVRQNLMMPSNGEHRQLEYEQRLILGLPVPRDRV